ncbi:MAG: efflux RND transporter permease subunit, partial [Deltaproteobacteria bacterium]|nr:efflux RND transporter permease subunit [Deltaproteobacteria bacterium]
MEQFLKFFAQRHILANLMLFGVLIFGVYSWFKIGKEAMPNLEFNAMVINTIYPGATAEDVDVLVTEPIENVIKGISGIEEVNSTSSNGRSSIRVSIDDHHPNVDEVMQEIKDGTMRAELPEEAEEPTFRRFRTSERAIIDVGLYIKDVRILDASNREKLQTYALALENKLLGLKEISAVSRRGYRKPNLIIKVQPDKLLEYNLSVSEIITQVKNHEVRMPGGNLEDLNETEISVLIENRTPEDLKKLVVRGGFEGNLVTLGQVADVVYGFSRTKEIRKIQGHEGITLNISKSSSYDILTAREALLQVVDNFRTSHSDFPVEIITMDDESYDTRNRLALIGMNGLIGFILILIILFLFLDFKSGVWVSMGIPFTLCFTLIYSYMVGYTVNNITLAAIIIVLGMVVDDAIIVTENVSREKARGHGVFESAITGTKAVFLPVIASVATTCAAFVPFLFFSGHFGIFVSFIPIIIFVMLGSSLLESFLILPSHLMLRIPDWFKKIFLLEFIPLFRKKKLVNDIKRHWFMRVEDLYEKVLIKTLHARYLVVLFFILLLVGSGWLMAKKMKYVM